MILKLAFLLCFASPAFAQVYFGATSRATGMSGRAAVDIGDSTFLNPASVVHIRNMAFSFHYLNASDGLLADDQSIALTFTDNSGNSIVPASFGYVQKSVDYSRLSGQIVKERDFHLSMAQFVVRQFSFGLAIHRAEFTVEDTKYGQNNADIGVLYTPFDNFGVGFVVYEMLTGDGDLPSSTQRKARQALGLNHIYKSFLRTRLDMVFGDISATSLGIESFLNKFLIARAGYFSGDYNILSAGLGFEGPKFRLNYAYQMGQGTSDLKAHSIDFVLPF